MSKPLFSVIVPTHNGEKRIRNSLHSVKKQTFKDYELIVVCDNCDDNTSQIALGYADKTLIRNCGSDGLARNVGLDDAKGEWILFLDDDDYFLHEYCFEQLADITRKTTADVIDFSFIWKGEGYKVPSPDEQFVMVWCRAWRRSFIGDNRFSNAPYGSDKEFYERMIQDNPDVVVTFWNMPMYYYNYMRKGSLSWMEKKKPVIDIIVTHYDEPWELGKPFFDMLENQRLIDLHNIRVIIVQIGERTALNWRMLLSYYHFQTVVITNTDENTLPGTARNSGLKHAEADWVMFFNFDDHFADVCALSMILDQFPTNDCDIIWMKIVQEQKWFTGNIYMNCIDGVNFSTTDGKLYRTSFLRDNQITFPQTETNKYYYEHSFNSLVLAIAPPFRIAALTTDFYPVYKTFRPDSYRHTLPAMLEMSQTTFERDVAIADMLRERGYTHEFKRTMAKAIIGQYYELYDPPTNPDKTREFAPELLQYYRENREIFQSISPVEIDPIREEAEIETYNTIQRLYNEHKREFYILYDDIAFDTWLSILDNVASGTQQSQETPVPDAPLPTVPEPEQTVTTPSTSPRVVVYCGTYDVYMNMVASCKSLLAMTPVDKVYFLIEDDTFPYELPDIVETINIKPAAMLLFDKDGPNFNNSWTYMCMIRSAFPEIFKEYDRILSLDIDIVINDNVSDLWDYDISDYYLAGVPERQRQKSSADPLYINFGVVLMNLKKLREDDMPKKITDALNTQKFGCPEQDAYNKFCANHILDIPNDFNYTTYSHITGDVQKERIIHYAGQKFWRHYAIVKQYSDLDWDTVMSRQNLLKEGEHHAE